MATLTSTGNVNLTTSTNWSPAQVPTTGDALILAGAHTLNLDADMTLDSITFTNANAKLAIGGTSRVVNCTNGFDVVGVNLSANLIATAILTGTSLTLRGTWRSTGSSGTINSIATSTGGNLTLATIGDDPSSVLFEPPNILSVTRVISNAWSLGTLTTIGRFNLAGWTASSALVTMSSGLWNHYSEGENVFGSGSHRTASMTGNSQIHWEGSIVSESTQPAGLFQIISTGTQSIGKAGDSFRLLGTANGLVRLTADGTCEVVGSVSAANGGLCFWQNTGTIRHRNQSHTIPATDYYIAEVTGGVFDCSGLQVSSAKGIVIYKNLAATVISTNDTLFTCLTNSAFFGCYFDEDLESRFVILESDPPILPSIETVAAGEVYGYSASLLTGTGLILDPAVLASGVAAALDNISPTALARFVTIDTGETEAAAGSVASFGGGGSGGDPWETELPGDYDEGTAGYIVGLGITSIVNGLDTIDVKSLAGSETAVQKLRDSSLTIIQGEVQDESTTTSIKCTLSPSITTSKQIKPKIILFTSDTITAGLRALPVRIYDVTIDGADITITVNTLPETPVEGDTFIIA